MQHDLLNDALVQLRHADRQGRATVALAPTSKLIGEVLRIFRENQYIQDFTFVEDGRGGRYEVALSRRINSCGVIKPRISVRGRAMERYEARYLPAQDFGVLILTTNQGVVTHPKARELGIGGRLLAYVY
ncbi:MAG TPA: 30S ribosomal protein S8 [Thermoplasmata archaeon]|nr:30S ribosomal protein S8 [Thermoplasmata archaeon]